MTVRNVWTGSMGPFQYDDAGAFKDGTPYRALRTDGSISTSALKIFGGSPAAGKVWTATNSAGDGAWQDAAGGGGVSEPEGLIRVSHEWSGLMTGTTQLAYIDTPVGSGGSYEYYIQAFFTRISATQGAYYQRIQHGVVLNRSDGTKVMGANYGTNLVSFTRSTSSYLVLDGNNTNISFPSAPSNTREVVQTIISYGLSTDVTTPTSLKILISLVWRGYSLKPTITFL